MTGTNKENGLIEIVAANIRRLRSISKVSAIDLAHAIGVSPSTVSDWENMKTMPRVGAVEQMSAFFNVPKSVILTDPSDVRDVKYDLVDINALLSTPVKLCYKSRLLSDKDKVTLHKITEAIFGESE
jgi:transcriptional regulator with XRE-family HTH domain